MLQKVGKVAKGIDDLGKLIADPSGAGPVGAVVSAAGRSFCDAFSNAEILRGDEPGAQLPLVGIGRAAAGLVCGPYLDGAGFDPPEIGPPPFNGGQCEGLGYLVTYEYNPVDTAGNDINPPTVITDAAPIAGGVPGPIRGVEGRLRPGGADLFILYGAGLEVIDRQSNAPQGDFRNARVLSVRLLSGAPDNCGDPDGEFEPGANPAPSPGPFPPGQEPGIGPDGQPFFFVPPIQTPFGELPFDGDYFGDEPAGSAPAGGDGLPGDGMAIGGEAGESSGGEDGSDIDFGEPPEGRSWVGCIVEMEVDPRLGNIPGTGPDNTVYPQTLGNVSLNYGSFGGSNVRLLARFTEVVRPVTSLIVTGCFLQTQIGATARVYPLSAPTCPENPCEI